MKLARKYKLVVIEDACESVGAKYKNRFVGTFGDIGVFAFYPNKQMTTGEGGMLVTNSKKTHELCLSLRNQGRRGKMSPISHHMLGYNYRMDEMSAALGLSQLMKVNSFIQERARIAQWYSQYLSGLPDVIVPNTAIDRTHSWFVYVIRVTNGKRDTLQRVLDQKGVQTKVYLPTIHLQPFMRNRFGYKHGDFPVAEKVSFQTLALPLFVGLKKQDVNRIVEIIKKNI
jgi:perosamine synthetase